MSHFLPIHLMVSNKKDSAAVKKSQDFLQELLEDHLKETASKSDDGDFFNMLVDEVDQPAAKSDVELKVVDNNTATKIEGLVPPVDELKPNKSKLKPVDKTQKYDDKTTVLNDSPAPAPNNFENVSNLGNSRAQTSSRDPLMDLKNVDYIKAAQEKVLKLEKELMSLRNENQELAVAGDHFKNLSEEQKRKLKSLEAELDSSDSTFSEEKKILLENINAKELRIEALQARVENLEEQIQTKFNRLRMRERELESRLAIIKQENEAVSHSKDDMLVDLKKQVGSLTEDLERSRSQYQKSLDKLSERDDALRRTVKALKLSLTMLESHKQSD